MEISGVPLGKIKERIDEQVTGVFARCPKRRKNSLLFSRNCIISKNSSEDVVCVGRSEDQKKDTRRPSIPSL